MLLRFLEDYYTFNPSKEYSIGEIPDYCVQDTLNHKDISVHLIHKAVQSEVICINCHGNHSNLSQLGPLYSFYNHTRFAWLAYDYPGYGQSRGKPSETVLYQSLDLVIDYVKEKLGYKENQIVLHGISLGGAIAIEGLSKYQVRCGIIDASFTNSISMAKVFFPFLPVWRLLKPRFNSIEKVKNIRTPVLFVHGDADEVIPSYMSEELYQAKAGEKELLIMPNASHSDEIKITRREYIDKFREFILDSGVT